MRYVLFLLSVMVVFCTMQRSFATCPTHYGNCSHNCPHYNHYSHNHSSNGNNSVYLVDTRANKEEQKFPNCENHYMITETITHYYSDGTRRTIANSTIYNKDGSVLVENCRSVKHILFNKEHYFIVYKDKSYQILDTTGKRITSNNYSKMEEIAPNRLLVKKDKKFGIIDLHQNTIVPAKYQEFEKIGGNDIYITKLNHYWGVLDIDNNILIENDCDKIKPLYDTLLIKRYNKYGLADLTGNIILEINNDKITKLGEYILAKKDKKYAIYDYEGKKISDYKYKQVKLERNKLKGLKYNDIWEEL